MVAAQKDAVVQRGLLAMDLRHTERVSIFSVSISLWSETLSVDQLSQLAGATPTRSHEKGDPFSKRLPTRRYEWAYWARDSGVLLDTWTLEPHWPTIAPILERLAASHPDGVLVKLSLGVNARGSGFAFDLEPDKIDLLSQAKCGVWTDTYEANRDREDRPDDYPGGLMPGKWRRARSRLNLTLRNANPFGKVRRHQRRLLVRPAK
jgi:hypothetical protein